MSTVTKVGRAPSEPIHFEPGEEISEYTRFLQLRRDVLTWASVWGGYAAWTDTLQVQFNQAHEDNKVDEWMEAVVEHANKGRKLLHSLKDMQGTLPHDDWKIHELWRLEVEMLIIVVEGLAVIETRANIVRVDIFSVTSHMQS